LEEVLKGCSAKKGQGAGEKDRGPPYQNGDTLWKRGQTFTSASIKDVPERNDRYGAGKKRQRKGGKGERFPRRSGGDRQGAN